MAEEEDGQAQASKAVEANPLAAAGQEEITDAPPGKGWAHRLGGLSFLLTVGVFSI
jgi:hypothetical protein